MFQIKNTILIIVVLCMSFSFKAQAQEIIGDGFRPDVNKIEDYFEKAFEGRDHNGLGEGGRAFYGDVFENRLVIGKLEEDPDSYTNLSEMPAYNEALRSRDRSNPKNFNPFNYKLDYFNEKEDVFYKVYDTEYFVFIKKR